MPNPEKSEMSGIGLASSAGQIAVFVDGEQVPELQVSWPELWARHAASLGYDPTRFRFEATGGLIIEMIRLEDGSFTYDVFQG